VKFVFLCIAALSMTSCNTTIGVWRDTKAGFSWTKQKIQGSGGGGQDYEYGAPVY
jgi:predicted small secreted protein